MLRLSDLPSDKNNPSLTDNEMETGGDVVIHNAKRGGIILTVQLSHLYLIHSWKRMYSIKNFLF